MTRKILGQEYVVLETLGCKMKRVGILQSFFEGPNGYSGCVVQDLAHARPTQSCMNNHRKGTEKRIRDERNEKGKRRKENPKPISGDLAEKTMEGELS